MTIRQGAALAIRLMAINLIFQCLWPVAMILTSTINVPPMRWLYMGFTLGFAIVCGIAFVHAEKVARLLTPKTRDEPESAPLNYSEISTLLIASCGLIALAFSVSELAKLVIQWLTLLNDTVIEHQNAQRPYLYTQTVGKVVQAGFALLLILKARSLATWWQKRVS